MRHVILVFFLLLSGTVNSASQPELPGNLDLSTIRKTVVQHNGRWMPLDTLARDVVEQVTGTERHLGHDAVLVLLAWSFDPDTWRAAPLITIKNAEARAEMQLSASKSMFSYAELVRHHRLQELTDKLANRDPGRKSNPLESLVEKIHTKLIVFQRILVNESIKLIPNSRSAAGAWHSVGWLGKTRVEAMQPARDAWKAVKNAFLAADADAFLAASKRLNSELAALPAAHRPSAGYISNELWYKVKAVTLISI